MESFVFNDFTKCKDCPEKCSGKNDKSPNGYRFVRSNAKGKIYKVLKECESHKQWVAARNNYFTFVASGFNPSLFGIEYPEDYRGSKSEENLNRVINYCNKLQEPIIKTLPLYLVGKQGTQKTTIAHYIGRRIIEQGLISYFILMHDLAKLLMDEYNDISIQKIEQIKLSDILILDESFDTNKVIIYQSGRQIPYLDAFIRNWIGRKGIIFISNVSPLEIDPKFGESMKDLICRETRLNDSLLEFCDRYVDNAGAIPKRLF